MRLYFIPAIAANFAIIRLANDAGLSDIDICTSYSKSFGFNTIIPQEPGHDFVKLIDHFLAGESAFCNGSTETAQDDALLIVKRGECAFQEKAKNAQDSASGVFGVISVNNETELLTPPGAKDADTASALEMFISTISTSSYEKIKAFANGGVVSGVIYAPAPKALDLTLLPMFLIALTCVTLGGYLSGSGSVQTPSNSQVDTQAIIDPSAGHPQLTRSNSSAGSEDTRVILPVDNDEEDEQFTAKQSIVAVLLASCSLLGIYFFYDYMVWFAIAIFCISGSFAVLSVLFNHILLKFDCTHKYRMPSRDVHWRFLDFIPKAFCRSKAPWSLVFAIFLSMGLGITWAVCRHYPWAWILQDIIGFCFCVECVSEIRVSKGSNVYLLQIAFCVYDIFMVYITPYFTKNGDSIMLDVATGGATKNGSIEKIPFLFRVPHIIPTIYDDLCDIPRQESMLGYGDIILPGVLGTYCAIYDRANSYPRLPFFWTFVGSYALGLLLTFATLIITGAGQPALAFIVPSTCIGIALCGLCRKEMKSFWEGPKVKQNLS